MPTILSEADKEIVKRTVPKASNKIQAVAVARLYVAHPSRNKWSYTGLQGAAVLSNDLVGNTFWIKLVDISPANRGVIWDQEIYDTFQYNQDRTFFHSFELEHPECLAGLSFVDEKEAKQFIKKMNDREKNAHKNTKSQAFGHGSSAAGTVYGQNGPSQKSHSRVGNFLRGHRHASNAPQPQSVPAPQVGQAQAVYSPTSSRPNSSNIDLADPTWRPILDELLQMGFTESQLEQNGDFIRDYIRQQQAQAMANGIASSMPASSGRAPPPPPPPPPAARLSPENTGSTTASRRGPPPAPPPSRRPVGGRAPSPPRSRSPPRTPSPEASPQLRFRAPPPLAEAGKFAVKPGVDMHPSGRARASSGANLANPGPPPPPRPSKTPIEEDITPAGFRVPPPFTGERKSSAPPPPPPPSRGPVPPPPPSRDTSTLAPPPPLPPKVPDRGSGPPPPPVRNNAPPLPPPNARSVPPPPSAYIPPPPPPPPSSSGAPPPPPLPPSSSGPPPPPPMPPSFSGPPPPPPMPSFGGPPPPPPPPSSGPAPPLPQPAGGQDALLASIRGVGGAGAGGLRKVRDTEKRDRSAAAVPGADPFAPPPPPGGPTSAGAGAADGGGLAGALAAALSQRKKKVSGSDDEKSDDDAW